MPTLTEKVNEVASFLAQVDAKKAEVEAKNQELRDLFTQVDAHYEELRQLIDGSRPTSPLVVAPVVEQPIEQPVTEQPAAEEPVAQPVQDMPAPQ